MKTKSAIIWALLGIAAAAVFVFTYSRRPPLNKSQQQIELEMQEAAVRYFIDNANPETGLVLDSADNFSPEDPNNHYSSLAATGYGLAVIANASERGFVTRQFAQDYVTKTMLFVRDHVGHYKGWLFHFVDSTTGARWKQSEYSTIDSALFLAGAIYAGQVFPNSKAAQLAHELYERTDFIDMMTDGGAHPDRRTLTLQYSPEEGYGHGQWSGYSEELILYILGMGHPTHPMPAESWLAFRREKTPLPDGRVLIGQAMPLFVHQYSELFLDFRHFDDGFGNYFANSILGTEYNRNVCRAESRFKTFSAGFWGLSAGFSISGYSVFSPVYYDGTVCLGCVVASAMFLPKMVMADAESWINGPYKAKIWGKYGLIDSLNLDQNWFSRRVLGITVGPLYISLSNMSGNHPVWADFNKIPEIQTALKRAASLKSGP